MASEFYICFYYLLNLLGSSNTEWLTLIFSKSYSLFSSSWSTRMHGFPLPMKPCACSPRADTGSSSSCLPEAPHCYLYMVDALKTNNDNHPPPRQKKRTRWKMMAQCPSGPWRVLQVDFSVVLPAADKLPPTKGPHGFLLPSPPLSWDTWQTMILLSES